MLLPEDYIGVYISHLGEEHCVSTKEFTTLHGFKRVLDHIASGGLFVIFPTGAQEATDGGIEFQRGFASIMRHIDADKMVYSFSIDPKDIETIRKEHPALLLGVFAEARTSLGQAGNLNSRRPREHFGVDENYSQAAEWQALAEKYGKEGADAALTELYLKKFNSD